MILIILKKYVVILSCYEYMYFDFNAFYYAYHEGVECC